MKLIKNINMFLANFKKINFKQSGSFNFLSLFFFISGCFLIFVSLFCVSLAQAESSDAIAIRVIDNNNKHYSARAWYQEQGFTGAPQSLLVDGYEAVRDGRTVYVNVANMKDSNLYTNIYLISYNQNAEAATEDIFGRLLSSWHFNTNLESLNSYVGTCSIATRICNVDKDCSQEMTCTNKRCILKDPKNCVIDTDCPDDVKCSGIKAKITRDVKRLGDVAYVNQVLDLQPATTTLASGSYIQGKSLSVWPSWQDTLGRQLGIAMPVDPINILGPCNYNPVTCWNEDTQAFDGTIPGGLPSGTFVYIYDATRTVSLTSGIESGFGVYTNNN